jgi:hypothetical protein
MRVDLLHVDECPNWEETLRLLRSALDSTGHPEVLIGVQLIDSEESADRWSFAGSPTILLDGIDPFFSDTGAGSIACRLYLTP